MSNEHLKLVPAPGPEEKDPLIGQVLDGRYEIKGVLGEGGMGIVYKARHVTLNKNLAIKVLKAEVSKNQEVVERFRQEAQSATAIGNHHIIDISDFGVLADGSTYFVMEFLDGISLTRAIEPGQPLKANRTIHIAKQLCRALGAAHDAPNGAIVHRDLKPDNIYLIKRGGDPDFVKVLDFGIAKVGGAKSKLTQVGQVFGTPHYMSPEQCAGTTVDKRTDVYALGVIMYEMASSRVPFDADNLMGILTKHLYEEPVRPHELPPPVDVPPELESVIMKCLAKKADVRYQSMQEVLADLEAVEQGLTPTAVADEVRRNTKSAIGAAGTGRHDFGGTSALTMDVGDVALPKKNNTGLIIGGVGVLGLILAAVLAFSGGDDKPAVTPEPGQQQPAAQGPTQPAAETKPEPTVDKGEDKPAENKVPEPPPPPTPQVQVALTTKPANVDVFSDGALIGHSPLSIPRPREGEKAVEIVLRADGYKDLTLRITQFSQEKLSVELDKDRRRNNGSAAPGRPDAPPATRPSEQPEDKKKPRPPTEVLDPWG
jgi:tRNA A-37 threonylcarbamoyl transferase component Bud32